MKAADIVAYEQVHVLNVNNGARFTTYAIEGKEGGGDICLNGAAARLGVKGDVVIILTYTDVPDAQLKDYKPRIVHVNEKNEITTKLDEKVFI
jgi:aspartate 1-decarboxylase